MEIGEKQLNLKYNIVAYDLIVELSDSDAIDDKSTKNFVVNLYAGMVGNCAAKDQEPDFTIEDVKKMVKKNDMIEMSEKAVLLTEFIYTAYGLKNPASTEGSGDTQQQALNVA